MIIIPKIQNEKQVYLYNEKGIILHPLPYYREMPSLRDLRW